jgi:hypothetical protein
MATQSGRLQKYFCQPPDGPRHSFTASVPGDSRGARPPRGHRYDAVVIARALHALARGATYRQARIAALGSPPPAGPVPAGPVPEGAAAPAMADAKLVSRWLDNFAPLLLDKLTVAHAPSIAVARSVPVDRRPADRAGVLAPGRAGQWLLCLTGWNPGGPPRVWPAVLASRSDAATWEVVFRQCAARPALLLCESPLQEAAAVRVWGPHHGPHRGTARGRAMLWPPEEEAEVTGHGMVADLWEARRDAGRADSLVRRLAARAASIRAQNRADVLIALMALEVSGLATAESMAAIVQGG